jgi:hypothetical protein
VKTKLWRVRALFMLEVGRSLWLNAAGDPRLAPRIARSFAHAWCGDFGRLGSKPVINFYGLAQVR